MTDTGRRVRPSRPLAGAAARYPTVARAEAVARRLALDHPDRCRLREVGRSRAGRPLLLLSVDRGPHAVLAVGGPHPNEPVGVAATVRLAQLLLARPARPGLSWHLLLCLDPDGAALNAGWLDGPLTMRRHYEHFFRPSFEEQPELLPAPGSGRRPMPESLALTGLIDELRPFLQCSLHGVDFGGAFVQLTRPVPGLPERFARAADRAGLPLDIDSFDAIGWASPAPGTYLMPGPGSTGASQALPDEPELSTWSYATRHGAVTAVLEVPMWAVDAVGDARPHPAVARAVGTAARTLKDRAEELTALLDRVPAHARAVHGALVRTAEFNLRVGPPVADEWLDQWCSEPLTVSRVTTAKLVAARLPLRVASMLLRLLADARGPGADAARERARAVVAESLDLLRHRFGARWVPVEEQVAHQTRAVLAAAECLL
ncbi:3-hydroxyacyl-CoA dehydrogenase [Streptomyces kaniharaensis]|uniref:3-hydroxyacyl-CoA dehydrogenase n=1 Tax=Streptomyces kaniharaensis TaxID=212423 RepID=A0A6N7KL23_9ACTN|nr:M14 family zinc carboxypeptidase [Streptomyces kaniharaensis]MQS12212.1 3-hydroxyacyl-CoA dehydrogenase [Streptomyces kaniharaensis]